MLVRAADTASRMITHFEVEMLWKETHLREAGSFPVGHVRRIWANIRTPRSRTFSSRLKVLVCSGVIFFPGDLTPMNIMQPDTEFR